MFQPWEPSPVPMPFFFKQGAYLHAQQSEQFAEIFDIFSNKGRNIDLKQYHIKIIDPCLGIFNL